MNKKEIGRLVLILIMCICFNNVLHDILIVNWDETLPSISLRLEEWSAFETINAFLTLLVITFEVYWLKHR